MNTLPMDIRTFTININNNNWWNSYEQRASYKVKRWQDYRQAGAVFNRKHLHSVDKVGGLVELLHSLPETTTRDEWAIAYKEFCKASDRVGVLTEVAYELHQDFPKMTPSESFAYTLSRVLDETYNGVRLERTAKKLIQEYHAGYTVDHATHKEEQYYSVDFVVRDGNGNTVSAYQVKPETFFNPTVTIEKNPSLFRDRVKNTSGMKKMEFAIGDEGTVHYLRSAELLEGIFSPLPLEIFDSRGFLC